MPVIKFVYTIKDAVQVPAAAIEIKPCKQFEDKGRIEDLVYLSDFSKRIKVAAYYIKYDGVMYGSVTKQTLVFQPCEEKQLFDTEFDIEFE